MPAILLIAYGSCKREGLTALRRFDAMVRESYPKIPVRWAYTSEMMRSRLASQVRLKSDSVAKALHRLVFERYAPIAAQVLQIIPAAENAEVEEYAKCVSTETGVPIAVGGPLLSSAQDIEEACEALFTHMPPERREGEDVVLMGHGTKHYAQDYYTQLSERLRSRDAHLHLATMSGNVTLESILPDLSSQRVWLLPFLSTVGRHAALDMAGPQEESWKSRIEQAGHECLPVVSGLIEQKAFAAIWLRHLKETLISLGID